ncbi:MAG: hypothetical protein IT289_12515 [Oligoflexia bacterium]|nr:hypothetical protein [Oligoflexia bacterium]
MVDSLGEKELKKLSLDFRQFSSRLMSSQVGDAKKNCFRFINYIEQTPLLMDYIRNCRPIIINFDEVLKARSQYDQFDIPEDIEGEISYVYSLLKWFLQSKYDYYQIAYTYGSGNKVQYHIEAFNRGVVLPFIQHLENRIQTLIIKRSEDNVPNQGIKVDGNVGQINYATNSSHISANNISNSTVEQIVHEGAKILTMLNSENNIDQASKEETKELVETILNEIKAKEPKKTLLRMAKDRLEQITKLAGFTLAAKECIEKICALAASYMGS